MPSILWRIEFRFFDESRYYFRAFFEKAAIFRPEGVESVAVDIDFADDLSVGADGHNDLRTGFDRAGKIARIGRDIFHNHRLTLSHRGSADSF